MSHNETKSESIFIKLPNQPKRDEPNTKESHRESKESGSQSVRSFQDLECDISAGRTRRRSSTGPNRSDSRKALTEQMRIMRKNEKKLTLQTRLAFFLFETRVGFFVEAWTAFTAVVGCVFFVLSTYSEDEETGIPIWMRIVEALLTFNILCDYLLYFVAAFHRRSFFFKASNLMYMLSMLPVVTIFFPQPLHYILHYLLFFQSFRIVRVARFLKRIPNQMTQAFLSLFLWVFEMVFLMAAVVFYLSHNLENSFYSNVEGSLHFSDSFYFVMIVITTVGFGDMYPTHVISQYCVLGFVVYALVAIPEKVGQFAELLRLIDPYGGAYTASHRRPHVVVCGSITYSILSGFCNEFYHPDHMLGKSWEHLVILGNGPPSSDVLRFVKQHRSRVYYFNGSVLVTEDLKRVAADRACAFFVFVDQAANAVVEDEAAVLRGIALAKYAPTVPLHMQLMSHRHVHLLEHSPNFVCQDDFKAELLAKSTECPGLCTLINNLLTSDAQEVSSGEFWAVEFSQGTDQEIYVEPFGPNCLGHRVSTLASWAFEQHEVILLGKVSPDGTIYLNPVQMPGSLRSASDTRTPYFTVDVDDKAVVISSDRERALLAVMGIDPVAQDKRVPLSPPQQTPKRVPPTPARSPAVVQSPHTQPPGIVDELQAAAHRTEDKLTVSIAHAHDRSAEASAGVGAHRALPQPPSSSSADFPLTPTNTYSHDDQTHNTARVSAPTVSFAVPAPSGSSSQASHPQHRDASPHCQQSTTAASHQQQCSDSSPHRRHSADAHSSNQASPPLSHASNKQRAVVGEPDLTHVPRVVGGPDKVEKPSSLSVGKPSPPSGATLTPFTRSRSLSNQPVPPTPATFARRTTTPAYSTHVLVLGCPALSLHAFVRPLRAPHLRDHVRIVATASAAQLADMQAAAAIEKDVLVHQVDDITVPLLHSLGALQAKSVVILASRTESQLGNEDIDKAALMALLELRSLARQSNLPLPHFELELSHADNIMFLEESLPAHGPRCGPMTAAGRVFLSDIFTSLLVQSHRNCSLVPILGRMLRGSLADSTDASTSTASELFQDAVPDNFVCRRFGDLFQAALAHHILVFAIFRKASPSEMPYVYTVPPSDVLLMQCDRLFVIRSPSTRSLDAALDKFQQV